MILSLKNLNKSFAEKEVLKDVSLEIKQGEVISILGRSGSGKSTLLNILAGFERADSGELEIGGSRCFDDGSFIEPQHRNLGFVFQNYALFPHLTVYENLVFGISKLPKFMQKERADKLLEMINLPGYEKKYPHQLSGGEQQRVSLARVLATDPDIILFDEPFSNVDTILKSSIEKELLSIIKSHGKTAIFVTHDPKEALAISDRIAFIEEGRVVQYDTPQTIYNNPKTTALASFFGTTNCFEEMCLRVEQCTISPEEGEFKANVIEAIYQGSHYETVVGFIHNGNPYRFTVHTPKAYAPGDKVYISINEVGVKVG